MTDKESPDYWCRRIRENGAKEVERLLPKMEGKKYSAAQQALREHRENQAHGAAQRRDSREEKALKLGIEANEISRSATKWARWVVVIAVLSVLISAIALLKD